MNSYKSESGVLVNTPGVVTAVLQLVISMTSQLFLDGFNFALLKKRPERLEKKETSK